MRALLGREVLYSMLLAAFAHQNPSVLLRNYITFQTLEHHLAGILSMYYTVAALIETNVTHCCVIALILREFLVQGLPVAQVAHPKSAGQVYTLPSADAGSITA